MAVFSEGRMPPPSRSRAQTACGVCGTLPDPTNQSTSRSTKAQLALGRQAWMPAGIGGCQGPSHPNATWSPGPRNARSRRCRHPSLEVCCSHWRQQRARPRGCRSSGAPALTEPCQVTVVADRATRGAWAVATERNRLPSPRGGLSDGFASPCPADRPTPESPSLMHRSSLPGSRNRVVCLPCLPRK
jgi:hypothetical protein